MRAARYLVAKLLVCALLLPALFSCSRSSTPSDSGAGLLNSSLLSRIPPSSLAFFVWDSDNDAYKKFRASTWGEGFSGEWSAWAEKIAQQNNDRLVKMISEALSTAGLLNSGPNQPQVVRQAVAFAGIDTQAKLPQIGFYLAANAGTNFREKVPAIESVLKRDGLDVKRQSVAGGDGIVVNLPAEIAGTAPIKNVFVGASSEVLALATELPLVERALDSKINNGLERFNKSAEFQRARAAIPASGTPFTLGYVDLRQILTLLPQLTPAASAAKAEMDSFPIDSLIVTKTMGETPSDFLALLATGKNEEQVRLLSSLGGATAAEALKAAPSDVSFLLGFDGALLAGIKNAAISEMSAEQQTMLKEQLAVLDTVNSFGIGLTGASQTSPFPGLIFTVQSSDAAKLVSTLKSQLTGAVAMSGMPVSDWLEKKIENASVSYIQSPLVGLGVFMASTGNNTYLASSEEAVAQAIKSGNGASASLLKTLPTEAARMVTASKPVVAAYGDFERLASTIESVQGNLAAFTGGQSSFDAGSIQQLRKIGAVVVAVNFDQGIFRIQSNYSKSSKQ